MKIRIDGPSGYVGLEDVQFPIVVNAHHISYDDRIAYVRMSAMHNISGFKWDAQDAAEGSDYTFLKDEYVQEEGV